MIGFSSRKLMIALLILVRLVITASKTCPMEIWIFTSLELCVKENVPPDAVAIIYMDNNCHTVETDTLVTDPIYNMLPGTYRAFCTTERKVRFIESGCLSETCSPRIKTTKYNNENNSISKDTCDKDIDTAASLYSRLDSPDYIVQEDFDTFTCLRLVGKEESVTFVIFGDCSLSDCEVVQTPDNPSTIVPMTMPTEMPHFRYTQSPTSQKSTAPKQLTTTAPMKPGNLKMPSSKPSLSPTLITDYTASSTTMIMNCQIEIWVFDTIEQCENEELPPSAIGTIYADNECQTIQTDASWNDQVYSLFPGTYRASCTSTGKLRFLQSGCITESCSSTITAAEIGKNKNRSMNGICDRDMEAAAALYSRLEPPEYIVQDFGDAFTCLRLIGKNVDVTFVLFGDCSGNECQHFQSPTEFPTATPTLSPSQISTKVTATQSPTQATLQPSIFESTINPTDEENITTSSQTLISKPTLVPIASSSRQKCQLEIRIFDSIGKCINGSLPSLVGFLYADNECHTIETNTSITDPSYSKLPGTYRASCTANGRVRIMESGCVSDTCEANVGSMMCERNMALPSSMFSRLDPPEYIVQELNKTAPEIFHTCLRLETKETDITFMIIGDCSSTECQSLIDFENGIILTTTQFPTNEPTIVQTTLESTQFFTDVSAQNKTTEPTEIMTMVHNTPFPSQEPSMLSASGPFSPSSSWIPTTTISPEKSTTLPTSTSVSKKLCPPYNFLPLLLLQAIYALYLVA